MSEAQRRPTTDMAHEDWMDVAESEFVDIVQGEMTDKIGFVFEHPELGLHGFEYHPDRYHIRAVGFQKDSE